MNNLDSLIDTVKKYCTDNDIECVLAVVDTKNKSTTILTNDVNDVVLRIYANSFLNFSTH